MIQKRTKIIATIGPASKDISTLVEMIKAGMNVARLNFSHGSYASHATLIKHIRAASEKTKTPIGILQDLSGPKLRLGEFRDRHLKKGEHVVVGVHGIPVAQPIWQWVKAGQTILIDDGLVELLVTKVHSDGLEAKVVVGGTIISHKGVSLPGVQVHLGVLSDKDLTDLEFGIKMGVDFVALSFVKTSFDIAHLRQRIRKLTKRYVPIVAKIETPEALKNIDKIIEASDVIMIARGDMALNVNQALVPVAQKNIIKRTMHYGKRVIVATQMLDSMIRSPRPTRAELSDVANAVEDHADAVMLSGETAFGQYPVEVVKVMSDVITKMEATHLDDFHHSETAKYDQMSELAHNLLHLHKHSGSAGVVVSSLELASYMAQFKPEFPVVFVSKDYEQLRLSTVLRAVIPVHQQGSIASTIENRKLFRSNERYLEVVKSGHIAAHIHTAH